LYYSNSILKIDFEQFKTNNMNLKYNVVLILFFLGILNVSAIEPELFLQENRFPEVNVTKDVKFAIVTSYKGIQQDLYCDIYQPAGDVSKNRPCILWIHGGGFRSDSKRTQKYIVNYANDFAKRGFVCISIDYRLRDGVDMPSKTEEFPALQDAARDANTALDWIRSNAKTYNVDPTCLFIAGGSAGGRTAITVAEFNGKDETAVNLPENKYKSKSWNKKGIIAVGILWGGLESEFRSWTYPYLTAKSIPAVIIHGDLDKSIPVQNSKDLAQAMSAAGISNELHLIPELGHTPTGPKTDPMIEKWLADFFVKEWKNTLSKKK
jgi:acetyl esterase/lipase